MGNSKDIHERLTNREKDTRSDSKASEQSETFKSTNFDPNNYNMDTSSVSPSIGASGTDHRLGDDEIEARQGNYLISLGFEGSGKTVFQSFLTYYLTHSDYFHTEQKIDPSGSALGWRPLELYNEWIMDWRSGNFPNSTWTGEQGLREVSLQVKPRIGRCTPLTFSFLEVSGENLRKVVAEEGNDPQLLNTLCRFFENRQIQWTICFILDPERDDANDRLFENFMQFLDINFPDIRRSMNLGILISKPEAALEHLKSNKGGYEHFQHMRGNLCETYVATMAPRTYRILENWPNPKKNSAQIMALQLGESEKNGGVEKLRRTDFRDIHQIFQWLYEQFSGSKLGRTWCQKVIDWLKE